MKTLHHLFLSLIRRPLCRSTGLLWLICLLLPASLLAAPQPVVTLEDVPADVLIGECFTFKIRFKNMGLPIPADVGYGPFIDLVLDAAGADAGSAGGQCDGITFSSATLITGNGPSLGPLTALQTLPFIPCPALPSATCVPLFTHPFGSGPPLSLIEALPGSELRTIVLPFGHYESTQPDLVVEVKACVSKDADLGKALSLCVRGGFRYGASATGTTPIVMPTILDSCTWAQCASVKPTVLKIKKTYSGPEFEAATGPNLKNVYPMRYTATVDIATSQTILKLVVQDLLPPTVQYQGNVVVKINGGPAIGALACTSLADYWLSDEPLQTAPQNPPNNVLEVSFCQPITGTAAEDDVTISFEFFIPQFDANNLPNNVPILAPGCTPVVITNTLAATADWVPIDPRDGTAAQQLSVGPIEHYILAKCIAVQKHVTLVQDVNNNGLTPGDLLRYDIDFQISDYKTFGNIVIDDLLFDPQYLNFFNNTIVPPTFTVTDQFGTTSGDFSFGADLVWDFVTNAPSCDGFGTVLSATRFTFRVSDAMVNQFSGILRHDLGILTGGHAGGSITPTPATGRITFYARIWDEFYLPGGFPGNVYVDKHDPILNCVEITAERLNNAPASSIPATSGLFAGDDSHTTLSIVGSLFQKEVFAINGNTTLPNPLCFGPGDKVTFKLTKTFPSGDAEDVVVRDFPPLPALDVNATTWTLLPSTFASMLANCGQWAVGFGHTIPVPPTAFSLPTTPNEIRWDFGSFNNPANGPLQMEIYFTMEVSSAPMADGLFLTNEAQETEKNTLGESFTEVSLAQIKICQPKLRISKGIVACDNPKAVFMPLVASPVAFAAPLSSACPRFLGGPPLLNSSDLAAYPINSDLNCADAGDKVTFAIVVENLGSGKYGAWDVVIKDVLPNGCYSVVPGTLCVTAGNGATLAYSKVNAADTSPLFQNGIILDDPTTGTVGALKPYNPLNGQNLAIITFDVMLNANIETGCCENFVELVNYSNKEGGQNFVTANLGGPFTDTAKICVQPGFSTKCLIATSLPQTLPNFASGPAPVADVTVGEVVRFRLMMVIPEGVTPNFSLQDYLPAGLTYIPGASTKVAFVANSTITSSTLGLVGQNAGNQFTVSCNTPLNMASLPTTSVSGAVTFNLGTLMNNDSDGDCELVVIDFNAVVANIPANQACAQMINSFDGLVNGQVVSKPSALSSVNLRVVEPQLTILKELVTKPTKIGSTFEYKITVSNPGGPCASDAFDVYILDSFPSGVMPVGIVTGSLTTSGGAMGFNAYFYPWYTPSPIFAYAQKIPIGGSVSFRFKAKFKGGDCVNSTNTARTLWSSLPGNNGYPLGLLNPTLSTTPGGSGAVNGERNWANAFFGTTGPNDYVAESRVDICPDLTIMKTARTNCFMAGLNGTYDIVVKNIGCGPAAPPIYVNDLLPAGLTYVSAAGANWTANAAGTLFTYSGNIPPGGSSTPLTLTVSVGSAAVPSVINCANVYGPTETSLANNSSCVTVEVLPPQCLTVKNQTIICNGDGTYTYKFDLQNLSAFPASTLKFSMETPANATFTPDPFPLSPPLLPGGIRPVTVIVGGPGAKPGSTVCFLLSIHDAFDVNCCAASTSKKHCITLPQPCKGTFIPLGSVWKYRDTGVFPGSAWAQPVFNDTAWAQGPAQLGYGDSDEATVVNGGPVGNRYITTYFRKSFNVTDASAITSLSMRLMRDDGAVVYLNGTEVLRSNMPGSPAPILPTTLALTAVGGTAESFLFQSTVSPSLLVNGANVIAVEIHQANANSSDISFDLELLGNCPPMPAAIAIATPFDGAALLAGSITFGAVASPGDAAIADVQFYAEDALVGQSTNEPYSLTWSNAAAGLYTLTAIATDVNGLASTSAPVIVMVTNATSLTSAIGSGATWKYLDDGSDLGTAWRDTAFDDSAWAAGPAQLGFGGNGEATVINGGPATNRNVTTYFRHTYETDAAVPVASLTGRLLCDDGAVVHVNGVEVFRSNLPAGDIDYLTPALIDLNGAAEQQWQVFTIDAALLVPGQNVIAVEVHQANSTNAADLSFDCQLYANAATTPPVIMAQPQSQTVVAGTNVTFSVTVASDLPVTYQWFRNGVALPGAHSAMLLVSNAQPADNGQQYTVELSNGFGTNVSASATLTVLMDTTPPRLLSASAQCASNQVMAIFSESLDPVTVDSFNFAIAGVNIDSAFLQPDGRTVVLSTSFLAPGVTYTITVTGVSDLAGNVIGTNNTATFSCPDEGLKMSMGTNGLPVISWGRSAQLEEATQPTGPWTPVPGAVSPFTVQPIGPGKFYRLRYQ